MHSSGVRNEEWISGYGLVWFPSSGLGTGFREAPLRLLEAELPEFAFPSGAWERDKTTASRAGDSTSQGPPVFFQLLVVDLNSQPRFVGDL